MSLVLPNLICLGAPKCGTTTLYALCEAHPDICISSFKEPHFFNDEEKYKKGLNWYSTTYFSKYGDQKYIGDFTPAYLSDETAVKRIAHDLGQSTKLMYVLRNPSKRAYSHYLHWKRDGLITEPFIDFLYNQAKKPFDHSDKIGRIYSDSLYDIHLENLYKYFPDKANILSLIFEEDIIDDCKLFKQKFSGFLAIEESFFSGAAEEVILNPSQSVSKFGLAFKRLINSDNFVKRTIKKAIPGSYRDKMNNFLNAKINDIFYEDNVDSIDNATFKKLNNEIFITNIKRLEAMLDRPLTHWYGL